ncbi:hypothetical protein ACSSZE_19055 [Acidithiobacillus caldus]
MFAKRSLKKSTVPLAVGLALGMALPVSASALTLPSPYTVSAGPLGQIGVQGVVSGLGFYQGRLKNEVEHQRSKSTGGGRWADRTVS